MPKLWKNQVSLQVKEIEWRGGEVVIFDLEFHAFFNEVIITLT